MKKRKILLIDIETRPMEAWIWQLHEQYIGLDQIKEDWHILSWAAKWLDDPDSKIMYADRRNSKSDKSILKPMHKLLDEADVVVGQNGDRFDIKKLNARFIINGMNPPSPFKTIDTLKIAKKFFALTSNKLEYLAKVLGVKHKKLTARKFPGLKLWTECLKGNIEAWQEMKLYNCTDVFVLEAVFHKLKSWDRSINFNYLVDDVAHGCGKCGSLDLCRRGFELINTGKFQKYQCKNCGSWSRDTINLFDKQKKGSLKK